MSQMDPSQLERMSQVDPSQLVPMSQAAAMVFVPQQGQFLQRGLPAEAAGVPSQEGAIQGHQFEALPDQESGVEQWRNKHNEYCEEANEDANAAVARVEEFSRSDYSSEQGKDLLMRCVPTLELVLRIYPTRKEVAQRIVAALTKVLGNIQGKHIVDVLRFFLRQEMLLTFIWYFSTFNFVELLFKRGGTRPEVVRFLEEHLKNLVWTNPGCRLVMNLLNHKRACMSNVRNIVNYVLDKDNLAAMVTDQNAGTCVSPVVEWYMRSTTPAQRDLVYAVLEKALCDDPMVLSGPLGWISQKYIRNAPLWCVSSLAAAHKQACLTTMYRSKKVSKEGKPNVFFVLKDYKAREASLVDSAWEQAADAERKSLNIRPATYRPPQEVTAPAGERWADVMDEEPGNEVSNFHQHPLPDMRAPAQGRHMTAPPASGASSSWADTHPGTAAGVMALPCH
jgi:hypothetical protein